MFDILTRKLMLNAVLTDKNITELRWFVSKKFPNLETTEIAKIFADAVNKIMDKNMPMFDDSARTRIKTLLFEAAVKKPVFEITCLDVFEMSVKLCVDTDNFFERLTTWVSNSTGCAISSERFKGFVLKLRSKMAKTPQKSFCEIVELIASERENNNLNPFATAEIQAISITEANKISSFNNLNEGTSITVESQINPFFSEIENLSSDADSMSITQVSSDEYKPVFSFEKSSTGYFSNHSKTEKKKFVSNKSTIKKIAATSVAAFAAYFIAKSTVLDKAPSSAVAKTDTVTNGSSVMKFPEKKQAVAQNMSMSFENRESIVSDASLTPEKVYSDLPVLKSKPVSSTSTSTSTSSNNNSQKKSSPPTSYSRELVMTATAYDLSVTSCGKTPSDPGYGITATGARATVGVTVAVDPSVIKLGTKLYITFPSGWEYMNGTYIAQDTGGAIGGSRIDIFFGEGSAAYQKCLSFGRRSVNVKILS